jgi:glycyl-tRNA synthetase beta chain
MSGSFLLEVGCEEIPARMMPGTLEQLRQGWGEALQRERIAADRIRVLGTSRRLVVLAEGMPERQPDAEVQVTGPAVGAAFDDDGRPTRAAIGFAAAQGVAVEDLHRVRRSKGEHVAARKQVRGRASHEILAELIPALLGSLNFPKAMRWGAGDTRFVRPVRWIVARFDAQPLDLSWAGVLAGSDSRGHRRAGSRPVPIDAIGSFSDRLRQEGIWLDPDERRDEIERQLREAAAAAGGTLVEDPELLGTVSYLVEQPLVIRGEFGPEFLELPEEVLRTSMRHHQKCFSIRGTDGRLCNGFLAVADAGGDPDGIIRRGNEWVLRARLADARFFWEEDLKVPFADRCRELERVTFHKELGSYHHKAERLGALADELARNQDVGADDLRTACRLGKCDLTSHLVGELPELQGIMGGLYARQSGLPDPVCDAIYDQYLPRSLDDPCPRGLEGALFAVADRIDTLAGMFLLGEIPTGSRDPFGLRRAAQGICKIGIDKEIEMILDPWVERALALHRRSPARGEIAAVQSALLGFLRERLAFVLVSKGFAADTVEAVLRAGADNPIDSYRRTAALDAIRTDREFEAVAIGFKRVRNILSGQPEVECDAAALKEPAEKNLFERYVKARDRIDDQLGQRDYPAVLNEVASMRSAIDQFFDDVLVMTEDQSVRRNRIGLLQRLSGLFLRIADFSCMEIAEAGQGEDDQ